MHQQDLRVGLVNRFQALQRSRERTFSRELRLTAAWIRKAPALTALLAQAHQVEDPPDVPEWLQQCLSDGLWWPTETEEGRALLSWNLLAWLADAAEDHPGAATGIATDMFVRSPHIEIDDAVRRFVDEAFTPLFIWLEENLQQQSSVILTLARYVKAVEWFDRDALFKKFEVNTTTGEEVYNDDLQRFLFLDGGYVTHAKARSATGEPDLIGALETADPLVCDGKIFDAKRSVTYLAKGVNQVLHYARDHQKTTAYLTVYNVTGDRTLEIDGDGPAGTWPPYFEVSGIRVYIVVIRAATPPATASKLGKVKLVTLTRTELLAASEQ